MSEWQPITSAPKAETVVLVFDPVRGVCVGQNAFGSPAPQWMRGHKTWPHDNWYLVYKWDDGSYVAADDGTHDHGQVELNPTHWMPLPPPPFEVPDAPSDLFK